MTLYNVHIYREMRLRFDGIDADSAEAAAEIASKRSLNEADHFDDCDGHTFAALVDEECDHEFKKSKTIDFEAGRLLNAAMEIANHPKPIDYSRGKYWNIEQMLNGRWALWDKKEGFMDAVQTFDTQEEAEGWAEAMEYEGATKAEAGRAT